MTKKEIITQAIVVEKEQDQILTKYKDVNLDSLDQDLFIAKDLLVEVDYSCLNYKDSLALAGNPAVILKRFPLAPGIDLTGRIVSSNNSNFNKGDTIISTGFGLGEIYWGGLSKHNYLSKDHVVKVPKAKDAKWAMSIGTAGFTAMLAARAIMDAGIKKEMGDIIVSGASGGVGSVAIMILKHFGFKVIALTSKNENSEFLKELGADKIVLTKEFDEKPNPLSTQKYIAVIDTLGGDLLSHLLSQTKYNGIVCACGLASSFKLNTTVMPFILRGVNLIGIESVYYPIEKREKLWNDLADILSQQQLNLIIDSCRLDDITKIAENQLANKFHGRKLISFA